MKKNSWEKIWKNNKFLVNDNPTLNIINFHYHHLRKLKKNSKILDHGCGNGRNFNFLKNHGFDLYGIDISKTIINRNKKKFNKFKDKFYHGNIKELNFQSNYFDAIISEASLYYQERKKIFEEVAELYRILKKGGQIRVYIKSIFDNFYFKSNNKKTFEKSLNLQHWENDLTLTFLDLKDVKKLFNKFRNVLIGIEEFNYINYKKKHSYWIITAKK